MKGARMIDVEIGTVRVSVDCDEDEGFDGSKEDLVEAVREALVDEIESFGLDGDGWSSSDQTVLTVSA